MTVLAARPRGARLSRALVLIISSLVLLAAPVAVGATVAHAQPGVHDYVTCPEPRRGMGCGFEALVPQGSYLFQFRYRDNNGKIQSEIDGGTCTAAAPCSAVTFAVPRIDRLPLGYDVYTSSGIAGVRKFVRF